MTETAGEKADRLLRELHTLRGITPEQRARKAEIQDAIRAAFVRAEEAELLERLLKAEREYLQRDANIRATDDEYQGMLQVEEWGWAREGTQELARQLALAEAARQAKEGDKPAQDRGPVQADGTRRGNANGTEGEPDG